MEQSTITTEELRSHPDFELFNNECESIFGKGYFDLQETDINRVN